MMASKWVFAAAKMADPAILATSSLVVIQVVMGMVYKIAQKSGQ
jgi:hypothetical protein